VAGASHNTIWPERWGRPGFVDRADAGRHLAERLSGLAGRRDIVVLALPRGGVPVGFEVAAALHAPLDIVAVRKLGLPYQRELAMGAIGEAGVRVLNDDVVQVARVSGREIAEVERIERAELERHSRVFREGRPAVDLAGRTAVVVDDGIATGSTARAACLAVRARGAARVVLAVPVAPARSAHRFAGVADDVVCVETPEPFFAVGQNYRDFGQTTDAEVVALLRRATEWQSGDPAPGGRDEEVSVEAGPAHLHGQLSVPEHARGLVIFAHGSGSSRHSPRNRAVAEGLQREGLATLLFDLLTPNEEADREAVFDVEGLGARLTTVTRWAAQHPGTAPLPSLYFGASTGAAAALWAAAEAAASVAAVVSRGGRPDLAAGRLAAVRAPTLLIVGGDDDDVLERNRRAYEMLRCPRALSVVPGATHLFEEPGALEQVTHLAATWFLSHLAPTG
jgi:putative phosphoribosyl transferase